MFVSDEKVEQYVFTQLPESSNEVQCASKTCNHAYFSVVMVEDSTVELDVPIM